VLGLFWATKKEFKGNLNRQWLFFILMASLFQLTFLVLNQLHLPVMKSLGLKAEENLMFIPIVYGTVAVTYLIFYLFTDRSSSIKKEIKWGVLGGSLNGICTLFFIKSIHVANPFENTLIFPIFTVSLIVFCNIWGRLIYNERVNWAANGLCLTGICISAVTT
jgi:hypothetical protein